MTVVERAAGIFALLCCPRDCRPVSVTLAGSADRVVGGCGAPRPGCGEHDRLVERGARFLRRGRAAAAARLSRRRSGSSSQSRGASGSIIASAASGPSSLLTATARFSVITGEGCKRSSARIQRIDLRPVGILRTRRARVRGGDGGLDLIRPWPTVAHRLVDQRQAFGDQLAVPPATVLCLQQDDLARTRRSARDVRACCNSISADQPHDLRLGLEQPQQQRAPAGSPRRTVRRGPSHRRRNSLR